MKYFTILLFIHHSKSLLWNGCESVQMEPNVCAILYNDEDCGFTSVQIPETFGKPFLLDRYSRNEAESLIVNKGCVLQVFADDRCSKETYVFSAPGQNSYLKVRELESSYASEMGKKNYS